ncbi:MAG: hypothetical protein DCF24_13270 [Cyanobium sp.]|nr:MAG: hypothetical protein DCF24_13270 [Cyanobium sp.]
MILDHHRPFQRLQVVVHGAFIESAIGTRRIDRQVDHPHLRGRMAAESAQHSPDPGRIPAAIAYPADVHPAHLFEIIPRGPRRLLHRPALLRRPDADGDQLTEVLHREPRISRSQRFSSEQSPQRHHATGRPGFKESHRAHS